jgi:hypothetical protein
MSAVQTRAVLSVMMPAYNEERTVNAILSHVLQRPEVGEVRPYVASFPRSPAPCTQICAGCTG